MQEIDCVVLIGDAGDYVCASLWPSGALRSERVGYVQPAIDHEPVLDVVRREHIAIDVAQRPMKTEPSGVTSTSIVAGSRRILFYHTNVFVGLKLVVATMLGMPPASFRIPTRVPLYHGLVLIGSV